MAEHNLTGTKGEVLAAEFLKKKGYQILETNWTNKKYELDIIAQKGNTLFVIEVKTRTGNYFGEPEEWVTKSKQENLIRGANSYILKNDLDVEVQFDIVSIILKGENHTIHHIEDAFYARL